MNIPTPELTNAAFPISESSAIELRWHVFVKKLPFLVACLMAPGSENGLNVGSLPPKSFGATSHWNSSMLMARLVRYVTLACLTGRSGSCGGFASLLWQFVGLRAA